ncbi:MAG: transposase [Bacteroidales bacterium]|nr:transposase [Bacteroidales bacterium]
MTTYKSDFRTDFYTNQRCQIILSCGISFDTTRDDSCVSGVHTSSTERLLENTFTKTQLESINTVSMDMWRPYMQSAERKVPNAELVHGKLHLGKYLNEAIDKVRRREVLKKQPVLTALQ